MTRILFKKIIRTWTKVVHARLGRKACPQAGGRLSETCILHALQLPAARKSNSHYWDNQFHCLDTYQDLFAELLTALPQYYVRAECTLGTVVTIPRNGPTGTDRNSTLFYGTDTDMLTSFKCCNARIAALKQGDRVPEVLQAISGSVARLYWHPT